MRYKVKQTYDGRHYKEYRIFYKKWFWLFWVDSGLSGSYKDDVLRIAHDLSAGEKK